MSTNRLFIAATASIWLFGTTSALALDWQLREVSGSVRVALPARAATNGTVGQVLPIGTSVTTGQGGRAVIVDGDQRIVVGPSSRTTLAPEQGGVTRILQDLGSALFQVDRRSRPHFRVETPLLAAVVKGTTFTISVDAQGDRVHVAEGLVEVRSNSGNATSDVAAGATAVVTREQPASVDVSAPSASVPVETAAVTVAPIDYSEASGGLVQNPVGSVAAASAAVSPTGFGEVGNGPLYASPSVAGVQAAAELNRNDGNPSGGNANPGNGNPNPGNEGGNPNPGNGNGGGETSTGNPGNSNGNSGGNANPGNGGGNSGSNPGNGGGDANPGNGGGNSGSNPGNGGGDANPGNGGGNANPGNGGNGGANPGDGGGDANPGGGGRRRRWR
ncbi:MAG: hypothetical protein B7Z01_14895 [Brevundimonas subvibrioides]|uniref:FecR protein domain-containing protein n=1 Tax=Brevundimonas subvibrioides TaxID=74313 RepID=A0A258FEE1_9CAUL|nr:MAG: hypothetical protein B7Z01_14895 [Brevundimonas subvibrioides]